MKVGDEFFVTTGKKPFPKVRIKKFVTEGCQLHGDPIDRVHVEVIEPGHDFKKGCTYILDAESVALPESPNDQRP